MQHETWPEITTKLRSEFGPVTKPGWSKPKPPVCGVCGASIDLVAVNEGECYLMWDETCPNEHCYVATEEENRRLVGDSVWPFLTDFAHPYDLEAVGIKVV
jgi:hypothetical protein